MKNAQNTEVNLYEIKQKSTRAKVVIDLHAKV